MTPKQKAKELTSKFNKLIEYIDGDTGTVETDTLVVKQCALISVDEVIKALEEFTAGYKYKFGILFWKQVKEEINKL